MVKRVIIAVIHTWTPNTPQLSHMALRSLIIFSEPQCANLQNGNNKDIYLIELHRKKFATSTLVHSEFPILVINMLSSLPTVK